MNIYYVYQYICPISLLPFYIGKGKNNRFLSHLKENYKNSDNKKKWCKIESLRKKGLEPIIEFVKMNLSENEAYNLEKKLIKKFGRKGIDENGILTNICLDNRPPKVIWTDEMKEEQRRKRTGTKHSDLTKEKCRQINLGKKKSETHKKNIKENCNNKGNKNPKYDKTIYTFFNTKSDEVFVGTRYELIIKYNLLGSEICRLLKGLCKSHRGWIIRN